MISFVKGKKVTEVDIAVDEVTGYSKKKKLQDISLRDFMTHAGAGDCVCVFFIYLLLSRILHVL